jgi:hypothetical protein
MNQLVPLVDAAQRARVERLLRGDFRVDDLTRLFLYARDRCDGREPVREVGDFVAHHDERTKGLVTPTTRDWFSIARVWGAAVQLNQRIDLNNMPGTFPDFLWANLRRQPVIISRNPKITRDKAERRLPDIVKLFIQKPDGTLSISSFHSIEDHQIIAALANNVVVRSAFDDNRLCSDFSATLKSHGLLTKRELVAFREIYPVITLFAVSAMHNCEIVLTDGSRVKLKAEAHPGGHIDVSAPIPIPAPALVGADHFLLSSTIFKTALDISYCEPGLAAEPQAWSYFVEVTPNKKLGKLA